MEDRLAFLLAESGIRQLYGRYADSVWRKDFAAFEDCFTADAVWKINGLTVQGRPEICKLLAASLEASEKVMMWVGISVIEVDGSTATGRTPITELIKRKDGSGQRTLAHYYDRFVEQDGVWRFQWHHFNFHYLGPTDLSVPYLESTEFGPPPGFPGADDPTPALTR